MQRPLLSSESYSDRARKTMNSFHNETVKEVSQTIKKNRVVVIGMGINPVVKKVKKLLEDSAIEYVYLEYGSYFSKWHSRLAIKLWSGWPTFPQVFVDGSLIGGCKETAIELKKGRLKALTSKTQIH